MLSAQATYALGIPKNYLPVYTKGKTGEMTTSKKK